MYRKLPEATWRGPAWNQVHTEESRAQMMGKGLLMAQLEGVDPDIAGCELFMYTSSPKFPLFLRQGWVGFWLLAAERVLILLDTPASTQHVLTSFFISLSCSWNLAWSRSCSRRIRLASSRRRTAWSCSIFSTCCFCWRSRFSSSVSKNFFLAWKEQKGKFREVTLYLGGRWGKPRACAQTWV